MKQNIILWICAAIIVFVAAYYKTITSPYYPVSGAFGIEGERVTFKFDKLWRGEGDYPVMIRTDKKGLEGFIKWKPADKTNWDSIALKEGNLILSGSIPRQRNIVFYKAEIIYKGKSFIVPRYEPVRLEFRNKISSSAESLFYFFLFGGLLLAIRSGLEVFRNNFKLKALTVFALIFFALLTFIFGPLRNSYDAGLLTDHIPQFGQIFLIRDALYFLIWLAGLLAIRRWKYSIPAASILILVYFLVTGYPR